MRCLKCGKLPCTCVKPRKLKILDPVLLLDVGVWGTIQGFHERGKFARVKLKITGDILYILTERLQFAPSEEPTIKPDELARIVKAPNPPHNTPGERCECTGCAEWRQARVATAENSATVSGELGILTAAIQGASKKD